MAKFWKIIKAVIFGWGALTLVVLLLLWLVNIKATIFNDDARPEPLWEPRIVKRALNIREAWQIGENDPDISALQEDSEPIVPEGILNPPFVDAMKRWQKLKKDNTA